MTADHSPWFVLINPAAGKGLALRKWDVLRQELEKRSIPYAFSLSMHRGHITELAHNATIEGYGHIISIGGDGTHHEALNGILTGAQGQVPPSLAMFSSGTGNDWVRTHGIPRDAKLFVQMCTDKKVCAHSAGLITYSLDGQTKTRYFMGVAGMAFDGRVVETLPESFRKVRILPTYLVAGLRQLMTYRAPEITIQTNSETLNERFMTVHAGICKYSGGGMQFVPHARPEATDLAITCIKNMSIPRLLLSITRLYTGKLLSHPRVIGLRSEHIHIHSPSGEPIPIEADGEFLGYAPISISVIPNAFRLIVP